MSDNDERSCESNAFFYKTLTLLLIKWNQISKFWDGMKSPDSKMSKPSCLIILSDKR